MNVDTVNSEPTEPSNVVLFTPAAVSLTDFRQFIEHENSHAKLMGACLMLLDCWEERAHQLTLLGLPVPEFPHQELRQILGVG